MKLNMEASVENKNTPINLAQKYWNLAGNDSWNIVDHMIQIWGPHITHVDQHTDHASFLRKGISFRFHHKKWIGKSTREVGIRYDHNYVLDCPDQEKDGLKHATKLKDGSSEQVILHGCGLGN